jgi:maltose phosphorylase
MKSYIKIDPWKIIEKGFHNEYNEVTESLMSLGNGRMGQRGGFEEYFSGQSLQGNYIAGVWFPDKTRVGWWKNGYPDYFAKVINATDWTAVDIYIEKERVDLASAKVLDFYRELNMQKGILTRKCKIELNSGKQIEIISERFCSLRRDEMGLINYSIKALNFSGNIDLEIALDGDVKNKDANHGEKFWEPISSSIQNYRAHISLQTKKSPWNTVPQFQISTAMDCLFFMDENQIFPSTENIEREKYISFKTSFSLAKDSTFRFEKYVVNLSSENHTPENFETLANAQLDKALKDGYALLKNEHTADWTSSWEKNDIVIEGDIAAQQGIRFNIFHLMQTYTGKDSRLNIGPKGFTGEKYGGVTYWDTEAYCLPFYLAAADASVAKNLLVYRHNQLQKAIENAQKLGFSKGAALYPMVTMNGEECHNEWEITFEEIHRNGAIAYAIYDYVNYTKDQNYLFSHGLEVLIGISRFWAQRVNWSVDKQKYVMLGVTGPNEYENNVNNNWYTNYLAVWVLKYTLEVIEIVKKEINTYKSLSIKVQFEEESETDRWKDIISKMYFPYDAERAVFLQQDGFLDKVLIKADDIKEQRPINQKWSWDRILRSCFIKQADVLQGFYFFEDDFSKEELERNFDFYEPMTVHESSLSPCVHSVLACKLDRLDKAYEMYLRTSRLDIDDYNNDTEDGLHITSMAGTWMSMVKGFGGFRVKDGIAHLQPKLPTQWQSISFRIRIADHALEIKVSHAGTEIKNLSGKPLSLVLEGKTISL